MTHQIPTRSALKTQAKALRASATAAGHPISHAVALETLAHSHGFRDWNALSATAPVAAPPLQERLHIGSEVHGTYLGHAFTGRILGIRRRSGGHHMHVTIRFDKAIDVVKSEMFSSFRQRVTATIDENGVSPQQTSDGLPHMVLHAF